MTVELQCIMCRKPVFIEVTEHELAQLTSDTRKHVQEILPNHTPEEREMFISRICGTCFDELFPQNELTL